MALRPSTYFETSSHFMPLPLSSMIRASSSDDHLLCFLAGVSRGWAAMLRFPPVPLGCGGVVRGGGGGAVGATAAGAAGGVWLAVARRGGEAGDSVEPEARRRWEMSSLTVLVESAVQAGFPARADALWMRRLCWS